MIKHNANGIRIPWLILILIMVYFQPSKIKKLQKHKKGLVTCSRTFQIWCTYFLQKRLHPLFIDTNDTKGISFWMAENIASSGYRRVIKFLCRKRYYEPSKMKLLWGYRPKPFNFWNQCRKESDPTSNDSEIEWLISRSTSKIDCHLNSDTFYVGSTSFRHWFQKWNGLGLNYP